MTGSFLICALIVPVSPREADLERIEREINYRGSEGHDVVLKRFWFLILQTVIIALNPLAEYAGFISNSGLSRILSRHPVENNEYVS